MPIVPARRRHRVAVVAVWLARILTFVVAGAIAIIASGAIENPPWDFVLFIGMAAIVSVGFTELSGTVADSFYRSITGYGRDQDRFQLIDEQEHEWREANPPDPEPYPPERPR